MIWNVQDVMNVGFDKVEGCHTFLALVLVQLLYNHSLVD